MTVLDDHWKRGIARCQMPYMLDLHMYMPPGESTICNRWRLPAITASDATEALLPSHCSRLRFRIVLPQDSGTRTSVLMSTLLSAEHMRATHKWPPAGTMLCIINSFKWLRALRRDVRDGTASHARVDALYRLSSALHGDVHAASAPEDKQATVGAVLQDAEGNLVPPSSMTDAQFAAAVQLACTLLGDVSAHQRDQVI